MPSATVALTEKTRVLIRQGQDVISFGAGEPDFDTPPCVKEVVHQALERGCTHYTHSLGDLALREAICRHYSRTYGVSVDPDQVVVTSGTSPAMLLLFSALLEAGDTAEGVN